MQRSRLDQADRYEQADRLDSVDLQTVCVVFSGMIRAKEYIRLCRGVDQIRQTDQIQQIRRHCVFSSKMLRSPHTHTTMQRRLDQADRLDYKQIRKYCVSISWGCSDLHARTPPLSYFCPQSKRVHDTSHVERSILDQENIDQIMQIQIRLCRQIRPLLHVCPSSKRDHFTSHVEKSK